MIHLVNNLLDLSKLEMGSARFNFTNFKVINLVKSCIAEMSKRCKKKNINIHYQEDSCDAMSVTADYEQIKQVVLNLLSNAIKFSPEGSNVEIAYALNNDHFNISISDGGCGVPEGEKEDIFNEFVQGSHTKTGAGGTGLGLPICKQIIKGHNGKIWMENKKEGKGSVFSISIPKN